MKFENTEVFNFEGSLRGMRNPLKSHRKSDSGWRESTLSSLFNPDEYYHIGENDLGLAQRLIKAGSEHRKFMRQIFVSVDITAPLYWWKEADTYKVGTTANSTSTMHKLSSTPITQECFEMDDYNDVISKDGEFIFELVTSWSEIIETLEGLRQAYLKTKDKRLWKELIRLLPESWLQTRTITMNYENIRNMYFQRKNHKLTEWSKSFVEWVESLPYAKELIIGE